MSNLLDKIREDEAIKKGEVGQSLSIPQDLAKMPLILDSKGKPKRNRANLTKILTYFDDNLTDLFIFNEATHNIEIVADRALGIHLLKKGLYDDIATKQIASYIANRYFLDYKNHEIADEVEAVAVTKSYHPIKDFLADCLKNKVERDPFAIIREYLNIKESSYNRLAFDLFFRGAIARALTPGVQFDFCLDLVGPQGGRKTTFLRQIFKEWYTDQISTFNARDDLAVMVQAWAVNDDELVATSKLNFGELKKAITVTSVTYRPPYGRSSLTIPVDFVFSRTTNETDHLGDATGDRRFLGVEVGKTTAGHKKKITADDLRDIWGNYYASYLRNSKLYYDEDEPEWQLIEKEREKFKKVDGDIELLEWYLSQPIPEDFFSPRVKTYHRKGYYYDLRSTGVAVPPDYRDSSQPPEWRGTVERDRVAVADIVEEIYDKRQGDRKLTRKIRLYFDNSPFWEKKKSIKFGKRQASGYLKRK